MREAAEMRRSSATLQPAPGAGGAQKHPITTVNIISPMAQLMKRVRLLPKERPTQCSAVNEARRSTAPSFAYGAAEGHNPTRNAIAVIGA